MHNYSTTYHSRASECLQNIGGTDSVVIVLILFPQMSDILLLKSVTLAQPQISNKIMCPYYPYVVLYVQQRQSTYNGVITSTYCMHVIGMYYRKNERRYDKNQKKED